MGIRTVVGVFVCAAWAWSGRAEAEPAGEPTAAAEEPSASQARRDAQVFRAEVGVAFPVNFGGAAGGSAGASAGLGALSPTAQVTLGPRLAGPMWLAFGVDAAVHESKQVPTEEADAIDVTVYSVGGSAALRADFPVLPFLELGGYGAFRVGWSQDPFGEALSLSGHVGLGAHFRPTDLFGVRTELEVFRVGHARHARADGIEATNTSAEVHVVPKVGLTLSF